MLSANAVAHKRHVAGGVGTMHRGCWRGNGDGTGRICFHARTRPSAGLSERSESIDSSLPRQNQTAISKQIKDALVQKSSRLLTKLTVSERPGKTCFRYWQEGPGFDRNLFSSDAIALSLEYIHNNPVSRGLCGSAVDWEWSSARYYLDVPARQYPNLPRIYGLPEGAIS